MKWISTRGQCPPTDFTTAILQGLAPDGGLYMPEKLPDLYSIQPKNADLTDTASYIFQSFLQDEIPSHEIQRNTKETLSFPMPIKKVGEYQVLELFHGPTQAFKDIAAQVLAGFLEYILLKQNKKITILVATSGDTGGAVAQAFGNKKNIQVVLVFPKGKVSAYQEQQLTHVAGNVFPIEVNGSFDDCQAFVKQAFQDEEFRHLNLSTANSINVGRLLPQMTYYAYIASQMDNGKLHFIVPSGNMGNVTAGVMAKLCGYPIHSFTVSCNANDPVVRYLETGIYAPQQSIHTFSNAMDIGNPSNFERLSYIYNNNVSQLKKDIQATSISDGETIQTIKEVYKTHHYLLDPHTAVAWKAAEKLKVDPSNSILVSTASPIKFAEEIHARTEITQKIEEITNRYPSRKNKSEHSYNAIKKVMALIQDEAGL